MGARGNSGVILSQIIRGLVSTLKDGLVEKAVFRLTGGRGAAETRRRPPEAVLKPIEGTILTVVRESADAALEAAHDGASLRRGRARRPDAARMSLDRTPELLPQLRDAGVVDAGGAGYLLLLDSALHVVDGEPIPTVESSFQAPAGGGSEFLSGTDGRGITCTDSSATAPATLATSVTR